jgi:hypothetical protein
MKIVCGFRFVAVHRTFVACPPDASMWLNHSGRIYPSHTLGKAVKYGAEEVGNFRFLILGLLRLLLLSVSQFS